LKIGEFEKAGHMNDHFQISDTHFQIIKSSNFQIDISAYRTPDRNIEIRK
jgi:hypothetical protein